MFDLIGDVHGHCDELRALLDRLGYVRRRGVFSHATRQAFFVGDFVDRGPQIRETLETVRSMVEAGEALAVMGNHELNALAFHTPDPEQAGKFLRGHTEKNIRQHRATLDQLSTAELKDALAWFIKLPLWLDVNGVRVVHACWDAGCIESLGGTLGEFPRLWPETLPLACRRGNSLHQAVDVLLKGKEARLPPGHCFHDKEGQERDEIRTRWYLPAEGHTYGSYALQTDPLRCDVPVAPHVIADCRPYPADGQPVFVGHYWLSATRPQLLAANVACLDFSVAKGGMLCAYRWDGERELDAEKFVTVPAA